MKKKAFSFKLLPSQKIKMLHTQKVATAFNFYRMFHFFAKVLCATVSFCNYKSTQAEVLILLVFKDLSVLPKVF